MSNIEALSCLTPTSEDLMHHKGAGLDVFYAFPAMQIDEVLSEDSGSELNPLQFTKPHKFCIRHQEQIIPLGNQVRFVRLETDERLEPVQFLHDWSESIGVTALYKKDDQLYLLLDIPTLLQRTQAGNDHE